MKGLGLIILAMLSGCATYFDSQDPCQQEPYPDFCGSAREPIPVIILDDDWVLY
jgi:hypothetical protein